MAEPSELTRASRGERKEQTRRAILDAALALSAESTLAALSLRQVAKAVGIVPTAFYRHFDSVEALGLCLVDESFVSLRAMLREVRRGDPDPESTIDHSIRVLVEHVHERRDHFLFIARERTAGPPGVRAAIRREIDLCERELASDLGGYPGTAAWSDPDLRNLANLMVMAMVATAEKILGAAGHPEVEAATVETAATQLRMVLVGAGNWRSRPTGVAGSRT